jgi:SRSO17 transposase
MSYSKGDEKESTKGMNGMATYRLVTSPLEGDINDFDEPVRLHKVDETKWESYWDRIVDKYHYLGYGWQFGGRVKYFVTLGERIIGAIGFCSAVYKLGPRDRYIGLSDETRAALLPHLVNNNRFLILPFVRIRNLASHVLSVSLKRLTVDWERQYGVRPYMVETFVDRNKFKGTSYRAANWVCLGETQGYGKRGDAFVRHGEPKAIYVMVISRRLAVGPSHGAARHASEREGLVGMINGMPMWTPSTIKRMGLPGVVARGVEGLGEALADHLLRYLPYLGRREQKGHLLTQIKGRLSDLERKSNEPVALAFTGEGGVRTLAHFMSRDIWDDNGMKLECRKETGERLFEPEGMITGDECDFPKKGKNSVGVQRQYCGRLGKTDNCQASVMAGYAGAKGYGLLDYELYMPEPWFDDGHTKLRKQNHVPDGLTFRTKNQMLLEMIHGVAQSGQFQGRYVGVDSSFGMDKDFLDSLPGGLTYFADVRSDCTVFVGRPALALPPYSGRGKRPSVPKPEFPAVSVKSLAEGDGVAWNEVVLGIGAKGPIIARDKIMQVVEVRDGQPGRDVWLYVRELEDGSVKYALCNEPMDSPPEAVRKPALMRWSIEQCFKECKDYLGMDHYEVRSWPGWHRHILITLLAHLFVSKLRQQFSVRHRTHGPAPFIERPVALEDYLDACEKLDANEEIAHADIKPFPGGPQQIMTIGLVLKLISPFLIKLGEVLSEIDYHLRNQANAFASHTKSTLESIRRTHCESTFSSG